MSELLFEENKVFKILKIVGKKCVRLVEDKMVGLIKLKVKKVKVNGEFVGEMKNLKGELCVILKIMFCYYDFDFFMF